MCFRRGSIIERLIWIQADYAAAVREVRAMGVDPETIKHKRFDCLTMPSDRT